jgi:uncharacterized protein
LVVPTGARALPSVFGTVRSKVAAAPFASRAQAFLDNLGGMFSRWENQAFNVTTMFASDENVAVFGDFRYRSKSLDKVVSSPFSILAKVVDGKVTYLQFQEDSYATAASFRRAGSWTVQTEPAAAPFEVGQVREELTRS